MSEKKCDCEGKMIATLAAGATLGLAAGLAVGWSGANYPENTSFLLAAFTSIGTVGAALAAVLVPLRQNRERREEQEYNRLTEEWVLAESVSRIAWKLKEAMENYKNSVTIPGKRDLEHFISQLEIANQSYVSPLGRIVISKGIDMALKMGGLASGDEVPAASIPTDLAWVPNPVAAISKKEIEEWCQAAQDLVVSSRTWQNQILTQYDPFGKRPPFVIRGRG